MAPSIIDNIPFTTTMLPMEAYLTEVASRCSEWNFVVDAGPGSMSGWDVTMIGASLNIVPVGMAEREGYYLSFMEYFKIAFVPRSLRSFFPQSGYL